MSKNSRKSVRTFGRNQLVDDLKVFRNWAVVSMFDKSGEARVNNLEGEKIGRSRDIWLQFQQCILRRNFLSSAASFGIPHVPSVPLKFNCSTRMSSFPCTYGPNTTIVQLDIFWALCVNNTFVCINRLRPALVEQNHAADP